MMRCDICGLAWDSVRVLYHDGTPVVHACADCIAGRYEIHELKYADGSQWYVEDSETGDVVSGMLQSPAEAHSFIKCRLERRGE